MADATLTAAELQRALHIDSPDELENAQSLQAAAEIYLENAGVERDYCNALYKQVVVNYIARLMDQPDLLTNLSETNGFMLNGFVHQLRLSQQVRAEADANADK